MYIFGAMSPKMCEGSFLGLSPIWWEDIKLLETRCHYNKKNTCCHDIEALKGEQLLTETVKVSEVAIFLIIPGMSHSSMKLSATYEHR